MIEKFRRASRAEGVTVSKSVYRLQLGAVSAVDPSGLVSSIHVPVLVTGGSDDLLVPISESVFTHESIPESRIHIFDGCGHASIVESAEAFVRVQTEFLMDLYK